MKIITQFPRTVREIENTWIPLADGTRLAAHISLPDDAARSSDECRYSLKYYLQ